MNVGPEQILESPIWIILVLGLAGLILCFMGFRIFRILEGALFASSGTFGAAIGLAFGIPWLAIVLAVFFGVLGYVVGVFWFWLQMVLMGAIAGGLIAGLIGSIFGLVGLWLGVVGAVLGGIAGFFLARPVIICATAGLGGILGGGAALVSVHRMGLAAVDAHPVIAVMIILALIVAGAVVQSKTTDAKDDPVQRIRPKRKADAGA